MSQGQGITFWTCSHNSVVSWASLGGYSPFLWRHGTQTRSTISWCQSCIKFKANPLKTKTRPKIQTTLRSWKEADYRTVKNTLSHGFHLPSNLYSVGRRTKRRLWPWLVPSLAKKWTLSRCSNYIVTTVWPSNFSYPKNSESSWRNRPRLSQSIPILTTHLL